MLIVVVVVVPWFVGFMDCYLISLGLIPNIMCSEITVIRHPDIDSRWKCGFWLFIGQASDPNNSPLFLLSP